MFSEIVGFDEIVGSYPPHSIQGYGHPYAHHRRRHHTGLDIHDLVSGAYDDEGSSGADLVAGLGQLIAGGVDPAEQLMAIAGLGGGGMNPLAMAGLMAPDVKKEAVRQAMIRSFNPRTIDVQSRAARAPRRLALNFRSLAVQPGPAVDLSTRPQLPFRPERLFVQSDIAGNFEIVDVIIGNRSQFAQATPMSARIAAETSFGFDLHMDTAMVAMDVVLRIANITGAPSDFRATIAGTSAIP